jgi:predicted house-cleaning noncanonical NTP pyrophosphatase (MazG superfamily)
MEQIYEYFEIPEISKRKCKLIVYHISKRYEYRNNEQETQKHLKELKDLLEKESIAFNLGLLNLSNSMAMKVSGEMNCDRNETNVYLGFIEDMERILNVLEF